MAKRFVLPGIILSLYLSSNGFAADHCGNIQYKPGGATTVRMLVENQSRSYSLYVPENYRPGAALVVDYHGYVLTSLGERKFSCWRDAADKHGFVVAYPQAYGFAPAWNGGDYCCEPNVGNDVPFSLQLVECLLDPSESDLVLNKNKVFAVGTSNGGSMAGRLACEHSDVFAGTALAVQSFPYRNTESCRAVQQDGSQKPAFPIIEVRGIFDLLVPYAFSWGWSKPALRSLRAWAQANQCHGDPVVEDLCDQAGSGPRCRYGKAVCHTYYDCAGDATVTQCGLLAGHLLYNNLHDFDVCENAWSSFERFAKQRSK